MRTTDISSKIALLTSPGPESGKWGLLYSSVPGTEQGLPQVRRQPIPYHPQPAAEDGAALTDALLQQASHVMQNFKGVAHFSLSRLCLCFKGVRVHLACLWCLSYCICLSAILVNSVWEAF